MLLVKFAKITCVQKISVLRYSKHEVQRDRQCDRQFLGASDLQANSLYLYYSISIPQQLNR